MIRPHNVSFPAISTRHFAPANRRRLSGPGLRSFLAIADLWNLSENERRLVLGFPPRSTFQKWCKTAREQGTITLTVDTLIRISAVLGIHQALTELYSAEEEGVSWLRTPNKAVVFGGNPPLDLVLNGMQDGLMLVRRFLDAARGGIFMSPIASLDHEFRPYNDGNLIIS